MCISRRVSAFFLLPALTACFCACQTGAQAPATLTMVSAPQGGKIVYGVVNGAATQGAAMAKMLSTVHNNCGEKPQIGRVFQFTGSNSVGVFFTVVDHPEGNIPLAGMVIAAATGPNQIEAAMLYDVASRFGQTVNPMLQQLSGVWNPNGTPAAAGGTPAAASGTAGASPLPASAAAGAGAAVPPLHAITLPDSTASAKVPEGWELQPGSHLGTIGIKGTHQEFVVLNAIMMAQDPRAPAAQASARMGIRPNPATLALPYDTDWVKAFPNVYLNFAQALKWSPTDLKFDNVELLPATGSNGRCVQGQGHVNNGSGLMELNAMYCPQPPEQPQNGGYLIFEFVSLVPTAYADQDRATVAAIFGSYQWDEAKARSIADAQSAPIIAQMQQTYQAHTQALMSFTQSQIARTQQIGAQATARMNASEAANSAEQANFDQQENNISRQGQGFSNYLLDQNVIQNNFTGAHSTQWNSAADAMVKANPNKYSYVSTPNYIPGTDY